MEPEKLFTINDVAALTSLTTRTIRNHLKDGSLNGHKVGGQWRFRMSDIEDFTFNKKNRASIPESLNSEVMEFLNHKDIKGTLSCTIVDICTDEDSANAKEYLLRDLVNWYDNKNNMRYTFEYKDNMARFIIVAPPNLMISALDLLS